MIRWAVTGPAAAGKSRLTALLAARGAAVVDGDALGHEVLARPETIAAVADLFGPGYLAGGRVDRVRLGALVFGDRDARERLDRLTHPGISALAAARLRALDEAGKHALAVFEAAVYFLLPSPPRMDLVITVTADPAVRIARLQAKLGLPETEASVRIAAQAHLEALWAGADLVFDNGGDEAALEAFADALWNRLPSRDAKD